LASGSFVKPKLRKIRHPRCTHEKLWIGLCHYCLLLQVGHWTWFIPFPDFEHSDDYDVSHLPREAFVWP
jgi:hypothetical protein